MPSSSSRTTSSGALISFFMSSLLRVGAGSLRPDEVEDHRAQDAPDDGCHHWHPGVAPVRVALAGDGEEGVGDAGAEVTGRVDGVPRRATEGEADGEDEEADEQRADAA